MYLLCVKEYLCYQCRFAHILSFLPCWSDSLCGRIRICPWNGKIKALPFGQRVIYRYPLQLRHSQFQFHFLTWARRRHYLVVNQSLKALSGMSLSAIWSVSSDVGQWCSQVVKGVPSSRQRPGFESSYGYNLWSPVSPVMIQLLECC